MKSFINRLLAGPCAAFVCALVTLEAYSFAHVSFPKVVPNVGLSLHRTPFFLLLSLLLTLALWVAVVGLVGAVPLIALLLRLRLRSLLHFALAGILLGGFLFVLPAVWGRHWPERNAESIPRWGLELALVLLACTTGFVVYWLRNVHLQPPPPNNALQRTEAGGEAFSDLHA